MRTLLVAGIIAGGYSSLAISQTERDLEAHEHGAAILTMVLEPSAIFLDFQSPWQNLVGFEHAPATDADKQAVSDVLDMLASPQNLFSFAPGNCTGEMTEIDVGMSGVEMADAHDHDEEHAHDDEHDDEHGHDDEHEEEHGHDDEHEEEHAHDDDHAHDDNETHSEVMVSYRFDCEQGTMPSTFTADLMQSFQGIESLQVEFVGPGGQSAASVTASSAEVSLESVL